MTTNASLLGPSSTNDLDSSMWQSGEICQVFSTGAFALFCHMYVVEVVITLSTHNLGDNVVVNVHFELELTLRRLRERLRLITPCWLSYLNVVGIILGVFKVSEPEEGSTCRTRHSRWRFGKDCSVPLILFPHVLQIAQLDCTRRDATALGIIRTLPRIDRILY